jgi:type I restriction enzyme, S subunit
MGSNYKKLGPYIQIVNERNSSLSGHKLLGVSIKKCFMPSIANIIGTDMSTYKLIRKKQFAYGPVTSRNGDKISLALLEDLDEAMVSQAYTVFEIKDFNELDPEYLMMWFRRPEFDRYARFKSHGSAREIFDWAEMNETELPIPSIEKQREIVREYNTIVNRIALNEQLIQKLEETAQVAYNKVVNENKCIEYLLKDLCTFQEGYVNPSQVNAKYFDGNVKWLRANDVNGGFILDTSRTLTDEGFNSAGSSALLFSPQTIVITKSGTIGRLGILCDYMCGNRAVINIKPKESDDLPLIFFFLKSNYNELVDMAVGSAQANLYVPILASMKINIPDKKDLSRFYLVANSLLESMRLKTKENQKLTLLKSLLLAKMTKVELITEKSLI